MIASSSSNDIAPLSLWPLTKKVGVEIDLERLEREALVGGQLVEQDLIPLAGLDLLFAHAVQLADQFQGVLGLRHQPVKLLEQGLDDGEIFFGIILADAARQHRGCGGGNVEREFPEHEAHLAGVDVARAQHREHVLAERRAMLAAHRCVFGDGDRRLRRPDRDIGQRYRLCHRCRDRTLRHGAAGEGKRQRRGKRHAGDDVAKAVHGGLQIAGAALLRGGAGLLLCGGCRRACRAHGAPRIGRPLVGNILQRIAVGLLGLAFVPDFLL